MQSLEVHNYEKNHKDGEAAVQQAMAAANGKNDA